MHYSVEMVLNIQIFFFIYIIIELKIKNVDHLYSHMSDLKIHQRQKVLLLQKSGVLELT